MKKIILAGGQNIGVKILDYLVTKKDFKISAVICRTDDTGEDGIFPSLKKQAIKYNIPVLQPEKINHPACEQRIIDFQADILISAMYNQIFKINLIEYFNKKLGIINIHYAPLPKYSGFWPEMWAIWNKEEEFGLSYHYIDEGIDTGQILYQPHFPISSDETRQSLYEKCDYHAFNIFKEKCNDFLNQKQPAYQQDNTKRTYCKRALPNDGFIDLSWDQETIARFIRATSFYPFIGAKIKIANKTYSIVDKDLQFFKPNYVGE